MALVTTADFITPPVDDPYLFGQIAAANSISDIYAMGGKPVTCLNLVGFPADKLDPEILHGIVEGALSKITESGAVLRAGIRPMMRNRSLDCRSLELYTHKNIGETSVRNRGMS